METAFLSTEKKQLTVVLLTYFIIASIFGFAYRYQINPDGLSLLRLANYISEGNFQQSITHSWSPLMTWFISFFIFLGLDGLIAARIAIALCGAGMLLCSWYLTIRFDLSQNMRLIASLIAALLISFWTVQFIAADVLFAALILCYILLVTDPQILTNRKRSFLCGLVGGFSYLAHHYSLPFFLVNFPAMLFLRGFIDRDKDGFNLKNILTSLAGGLIGFLIIASVWIGFVSVKYGEFTISSKGPIARASVGPEHKGHPFFAGGLFKPRDSYAMHVIEDPSEVKFKTWSPFENRKFFMYQLELIKNNVLFIVNHFVNMSPFFTYALIIGTLALFPIAFFLTPLSSKKKYLYYWFITTFCIYSSGFLLITARSPRRFYAPMILFLFLTFHFLDELTKVLEKIVPEQRKKILRVYLLLMVISAFALKPGTHFLKSINSIISNDQVNPYREIAEQIRPIPFPSPYAIVRSSQKPHTDVYIAYYLNKQLLGRPFSGDIEGITEELKAAQARSLLVFDNLEIVEILKNDKRYMFMAHKKFKNDNRYMNARNVQIDQIEKWDEEINIFQLK